MNYVLKCILNLKYEDNSNLDLTCNRKMIPFTIQTVTKAKKKEMLRKDNSGSQQVGLEIYKFLLTLLSPFSAPSTLLFLYGIFLFLSKLVSHGKTG